MTNTDITVFLLPSTSPFIIFTQLALPIHFHFSVCNCDISVWVRFPPEKVDFITLWNIYIKWTENLMVFWGKCKNHILEEQEGKCEIKIMCMGKYRKVKIHQLFNLSAGHQLIQKPNIGIFNMALFFILVHQ